MVSLKGFVVLLVLICCNGVIHGQDGGPVLFATSPLSFSPMVRDSLRVAFVPPPPRWYDFAANFPHDLASFSTLSLDAGSLPTIVGLSTLTLGLVATDNRTSPFATGMYRRSASVSAVSDFLVSVGDGRSSLVLAGGFCAYGFVASDHRALRVASQTIESLLATGVVVQLMKHMTGRESPGVATSGRGTWRPFPSLKNYSRHQSRYFAFPSGHIATTMATVTVLAENYPDETWLKPVGYSVVGLVGISLVNKGWHWYSDLPLGIALGYTFGRIAAHPIDAVSPPTSPGVELTIAPMKSERGNGLLLAMQF